jgi:transcriptional regulator with PAS, ATPase and Fis domain
MESTFSNRQRLRVILGEGEKMGLQEMQELINQQTKIMDNCFGNIFVTDASGQIIYVNQHTLDSFNCSREEFLSMNVYEMVDRKIASDSAAIYVLESQQEVSMRIMTNKGENILVTARPIFDAEGKLELVVVYSQSEKILKQLFRTLEEEKISLQRAVDLVSNYNLADSRIIACSPNTRAILRSAERIAPTDSTVILYGESGTGKEVFANFIHSRSARAGRLFLPVNCAAVPHELMESEFFGYEGGAFTGSNREGKPGIFEVANNGTLFLDEIGELPLPMQSKLLRVLGTGEIKRVGGNKVSKVSVRIIAATNRNLLEMVRSGAFREDLYYRLNVIPITIPSLRDRVEDIPALAELFLEELNKKYQQGKYCTRDAIDALREYQWPGNIRELKNVMERVFIITQDECLSAADINSALGLRRALDSGGAKSSQGTSVSVRSYGSSLKEATDNFQRKYIQSVMDECNGNIPKAADVIGMNKSGLYKKIDKLGMTNGKPGRFE